MIVEEQNEGKGYKMIKQYVRDCENNKIGVMIAFMLEDVLHVGYSALHEIDIQNNRKFDPEFGEDIAFRRAVVFGNGRNPKYIPPTILQALPLFKSRCFNYFKDATIPTWLDQWV